LKAAGADAVFLFGSTVEGPVRPDSDIDLAVAGLPPAKFFQAMGQQLQTELNRFFSGSSPR
jgi:predicted nucleotidyltransferase